MNPAPTKTDLAEETASAFQEAAKAQTARTAAPLVPTELAPPAAAPSTSVIHDTYGLTGAEYAVLLKTVCKDAPREIAGFFMIYCKRRSLDPFDRDVYLWKQVEQGKDKWNIVGGIQGMRKISARNPLFRGISKPTWIYDVDDTGKPVLFTASQSKYGNIAGKRKPISCEVTVYRAIPTLAERGIEGKEHWIPFTSELRFDEFVKKRDGKIQGNWEEQPEHQIAIRAEAHSHRRAFPEDVGGLYLEDELSDREVVNVTPTLPEGATRTEELKALLGASEVEQAEDVEFVEPVNAVDPTPATIGLSPNMRRKLHATFKKYGIESHETRILTIAHVLKDTVTSSNDLSDDQAKTVIDHLTHKFAVESSTNDGGAPCPECAAKDGEPHAPKCPADPLNYEDTR